MVSDSEIEEQATKKRKKGLKQVEYQRDIIKKARVKGTAYINYKGKLIPQKERGMPCR